MRLKIKCRNTRNLFVVSAIESSQMNMAVILHRSGLIVNVAINVT